MMRSTLRPRTLRRRRHPAIFIGLLLLLPGCRTPPAGPEPVAEAGPLLPVEVRLIELRAGAEDSAAQAVARLATVDLAARLEGPDAPGSFTVCPASDTFADLVFSGRLASPSPGRLSLALEARDAGGGRLFHRAWEAEDYAVLLDRATKDCRGFLDAIPGRERVRLRRLAELAFAADLAPERFGDYLEPGRDGARDIARLPAEDDRLWRRIQGVRARDAALHEAVQAQYDAFAVQARPALAAYLDHVREERERLRALEKKNRWRPVRLLAGGFISGLGVFAESIGDALGGRDRAAEWLYDRGDTLAAGVDHELAARRAALAATGRLLEAEMSPFVADLEGRQVRLTGSASAQLQKFRDLMREWHREEVGTPP